MRRSVLIDTGPLVSIFVDNEPHHDRCVQTLAELPSPLMTCWPVVTEAVYMLRRMREVVRTLLGELDGGFLRLLPLDHRDVPAIVAILDRYDDQNFQLADAALMHLSEREDIHEVFTLDRRDFTVFRPSSGKPLRLLPEGSW